MVETTAVVVEDDPNIADLVDLYLRREGWRVLLAADGERGLALVEQEHPRLLVLDIGLPGQLDGMELCRRLRDRPDLAIVMLTARDQEIDRVLGLELGADDYLTKPFSPRELVARVKSIVRRLDRPAADASPNWDLGAIAVDVRRREASLHGEAVALTTREFDLLVHLCAHRGVALRRRQLLDGVWGQDWYGDERTVDVHVRQLRRKLPPPRAPDRLGRRLPPRLRCAAAWSWPPWA